MEVRILNEIYDDCTFCNNRNNKPVYELAKSKEGIGFRVNIYPACTDDFSEFILANPITLSNEVE